MQLTKSGMRTEISRVAEVRAALGSRSIVFVGMMGAGKSAVGQKIATRLSLPFVDTDKAIEEAANGMTIPDIFDRFGESEFRSLETRVIARILREGPRVVATGGGAFMNETTRILLQSRGISVWLAANLATLMERILRRDLMARPMLTRGNPVEKLRALINERSPTYATADLTIETGQVTIEEVVDDTLGQLVQFLRTWHFRPTQENGQCDGWSICASDREEDPDQEQATRFVESD